MKKVLILSVFAFFALAASAQSTTPIRAVNPLWSKATAERNPRLLPLPPATPHWAPSHRPPRLNRRLKESKRKEPAKAKANLRREPAALKKENPKAEHAAPKKEKAKMEHTAKNPAAPVLKRNVLKRVKARAKALAAPARAKGQAALAKPLRQEIAKNNTKLFTAVWAHVRMRFAECR